MQFFITRNKNTDSKPNFPLLQLLSAPSLLFQENKRDFVSQSPIGVPPVASEKNLEKNNGKTKIESFYFSPRGDGNYFIRVRMKSESDAQALAKFCKSKGLKKGYVGNSLYFRCANPEVMAYFAELVCTFDEHAHPDLLKTIYNDLNISPIPNYQLPLWYREGNYHRKFFSPGAPLVRFAEFHSTSNHSLFKTISLCGYNNDSVQIRVKLRRKKDMVILSDALKNENLVTPPKIDFVLNSTGFSNQDMNLIAHYLSVVSKLDPTFYFIKKEIEEALKVNIDHNFKKRNWIVTGDFDEVEHYPKSQLCQQLKLDYTANNKKPLKSVEFLGYFGGTLKLRVALREGYLVNKVLSKSELQFPALQLIKSVFNESVHFVGSKSNPNAFVNVLRWLKQLTGNDFGQVEQLLLNVLKIKMRSVFTQSINDLKKVKEQAAASKPDSKMLKKLTSKVQNLSLKDKMNGFFSKIKTELGMVASTVEETVDTIVQDVDVTLQELATELEDLVIKTGEDLDETFNALENCIPSMTHLLDCFSVSSLPKEQKQLLREPPKSNRLLKY